MKSFHQFISEATAAADQAQRLGLQGDNHGGWYDRRTNEFVAKTEGGKLKFYNKRQRIPGKDPNQTRTCSRAATCSTRTAARTTTTCGNSTASS